MRPWVWPVLAGVSAIAVVLSAFLLLRPDETSPPIATGRCPSKPIQLRLLEHADYPQLFASSSPPAELSWDGEVPPPLGSVIAPGTHLLVTKLDGRQMTSTPLEISPFQPVMVDVIYDEGLGVLPLVLGARCSGCLVPLAPVTLSPGPSSTRAPEPLLKAAAQALRQNDWKTAHAHLEQVPRSKRDGRFHRLAAMLFFAAGQPASALASAREAARLGPWIEAQKAAQERKAGLPLERWNALTTKFASLLQEFDSVAPSSSARTSQRLEALSGALKQAQDQGDRPQTQQILEAAEQTLRLWVEELRNQRPDDCAFQEQVLRAVEAPAG